MAHLRQLYFALSWERSRAVIRPSMFDSVMSQPEPVAVALVHAHL